MIRNRKNLLALLLVLVLAVAAWFLYSNSGKGSSKEELKDFAFKDTSAVSRVFIADKRGNKVTLDRKNKGLWYVNNSAPANQEMIKNLLETIHGVEMKMPVGKAAFNTVVKQLAANGIKVEVYAGNELVKVYYVGGPTMDNLGTYMMIENSSRPFITWIQGFNGYLTPRYESIAEKWKTKAVFNNKFTDISSVSIEFSDEPAQSFEISRNNSDIRIKSLATGNILSDMDTVAAAQYLGSFVNLNYDSYLKDISKSKIDSLLGLKPLFVITLNTTDGKSKKITCYPIKAPAGELDINGKPYRFDPDHMFAHFDGDVKNWYSLQFYVFDRILKPLSYFQRKSFVKK